jgi:glutamate formiminotransferase/formiminotetrahydrofolate cyclodeaminase
VDEDTNAFNRIMDAFGLPKKTDSEKQSRKEAIESVSKYAIEIPLRVMRTSLAVMDIVESMVITGNPNSVSDAGVGALCVSAAVQGAYLNVKINAGGIEDKAFTSDAIAEGARIAEETIRREKEILKKVDEVINKL